MIREEPAFKIVNANLPLLVLHVNTTDMDKLKSQLGARLVQMPDFFSDTPMALGLAAIASSDVTPDFADLVLFMRAHGIRTAGVLGGSLAQREAAGLAGLGLFPDAPARPAAHPSGASDLSAESHSQRQTELPGFEEAGSEPSAVKTSRPSTAKTLRADNLWEAPILRPTMVIDKPVRAGQRIYAEGANLVVLAVVNSGAELIADGDIHIYAPLRGRVIAGACGNEGARIFAQQMNAELISIAGCFRIFEDGIPENVRGKSAQVRLEGSRLIFQPFRNQ
ncbi:MAG: septum site-determining protein MinC [Sulfuricellaceae bacterium]